MKLEALCPGNEIVDLPPGIHANVSREVYDAIPALSCTALKKWLSLGGIPSEFAYWMKTRWEEKPTEALLIGRALDCAMLDGTFEREFAVGPDVDRRTTAGKAQWTAFKAANKGKTILTADQGEKVGQMATALQRAPALDGVFPNCKKTVLVGELWGYPCKAEIDLFIQNSPHLLDLKTARDVSAHWFAKAFLDLGYDCQATFYLLLAQACGLKKRIFDFIAVKNEAPWTTKVHSFDIDNPEHRVIFDACGIRLARAAGAIAARLEFNNFKDPEDWELLEIPAWALSQAKLESLAMMT
jgi:PDDEXK-like domain of unknown function (DUF3799)